MKAEFTVIYRHAILIGICTLIAHLIIGCNPLYGVLIALCIIFFFS